MIYRLLILLGLTLVGVAVWLTLAPRHTQVVTTQSSGPAGADQGYSAIDASMVETGADGLPLYTLQAHHVQQDTQTDAITLSQVHMTYRDAAGGQWELPAQTAVVQQNSSRIDLAGAIDASGTFAGSTQPAHILTEKMQVDTDTQIIRIHSPVTLKWAGVTAEARGLVVNVKEHSVRLEGGVHGQVAQ